jgi:predicted transcriptional regulator
MTQTAHEESEGYRGTASESERLLDALRDADSRALIAAATDEPRTAKELAQTCDLSLSATYRRLDRLTSVGLLTEGTRIRSGRRPASEYSREFDGFLVDVTADGSLKVRSRTRVLASSD